MPSVLDNGIIKLIIDEPGENYISSRFDWTGKITSIILNGNHEFLTVEKPVQMDVSLFGRGLYNEFGISTPVGYDDCKPGEWFPKLGVGLLKKPDEKPFNFYQPYEINPFIIEITSNDNNIEYLIHPKDCRGYAASFRKNISLDENRIYIDYQLENVGSKSILTEEYIHNFIGINNEYIGPDYKLEFPFILDTSVFDEFVNPEGILELTDNTVNFVKKTEDQFYIGNAVVNNVNSGSWKIINGKHKVCICETVNFIPSSVSIWGWKHVISPEIFYRIDLNPGESANWQRKYELYTITK
ncbi:MAG: hypothetical protein JW894_13350 [Bacteroidales bacterium]|nr:hypothetical protein [Bacteroidales bacterium]